MSTLNLDTLVSRRPRVQGIGLVKAVLSGDTIVVVGSAKNGPAAEKRLTLASVNAPKLAVAREDKDEPYAYQSREYLRERVLGKVVQFTLPSASVETATNPAEASKQDFADITVDNVNLSELMVKAGYATVVLPKPKADAAPGTTPVIHAEKAELLKFQEQAKANKIGQFAAGNPRNTVRNILSADAKVNADLFKKYAGKEIAAYVDYVVNGSTLRVEIKNDAFAKESLEHIMVTFNLAGVEAPQPPIKAKLPKADAKGGSGEKRDALPGEPFGAEARQYTLERLQGQTVKIVIQAIDHDQRLYGTVVFPKGNISKNLLQDGFARYVPWSALATPNNAELKLAASQAKSNIAATSPYTEPVREQYEATVIQVNSGDSLTIKTANGVEKRVYLASVKAPRMGKKANEKGEEFAFESREFLRRSLIGKKVNVQVEYVLQERKPADKKTSSTDDAAPVEPQTEQPVKNREYVSMFKGKYNIAAELLANGLADIVPTPRDAPRSLYLAELCSAQIKAQSDKKHKWSGQKSTLQLHHLIPVPGQSKEANALNKANEERVEIHYAKLQNSSLNAVLDYVYSPTRFRVFVPTLSTFFVVKLAAIQPPAAESSNIKQLNEDAMTLLRKFVQHDITLEVTHRFGLTLVANIISREAKDNLALQLVQSGLATLILPVVDKSKYKKEFLAAQDFAKKQRLGLWFDFDEQKEKEELERQKAEATETVGAGVYSKDGDNFINVIVTDVIDPVHFYVNNVDDVNVKLLKEKMEAFDGSIPAPENFEPQQNDIIAGLFAEDEKWYRVRVDKSSKSRGQYSVQFIDFGNTALLPYAHLRPLPADLTKLRQLARPCSLSGLQAPETSSEWFELGAQGFADLTINNQYAGRIDFTERSGVLHLTLQKEGELSVNQQILQEGLALLNQRVPHALQRVYGELEEYESKARADHKGLFEYGDYIVDTEKFD